MINTIKPKLKSMIAIPLTSRKELRVLFYHKKIEMGTYEKRKKLMGPF